MDRLREIGSRLSHWLADLQSRSFALTVLISAAKGFNEDHCAHLAAGMAYYAVFSLFPLLLGLIALASFLMESGEAQSRIVAAAAQVLPGSADLVRRNVQLVLVQRGTIGLVAVVGLLWSAKAVFGAITTSLNLAWDVPESRPFWELTAMELALVIGAGFFFLLSLAVTSTLAVLSGLDVPLLGTLGASPLWALAGIPFSLALSTVAILLLYRFLPNKRLTFRDVWPGALVAGILFEIAKSAYVYYTTSFADYELVYGSLAAVIGLLFWTWISSAILLFGAEIAAGYTLLRWRGGQSA